VFNGYYNYELLNDVTSIIKTVRKKFYACGENDDFIEFIYRKGGTMNIDKSKGKQYSIEGGV
jgi:DNA-binding winged helix-turn-helix (wHTH) protein